MKRLPFDIGDIEALIEEHPTPFYVYDEAAIRERVRDLIEAFSWNDGFKEYYAVKALPNPAVLRIMKEEGCGADCSSMAELLLSERVGISGEQIMFTSNDTPKEEFVKAREMGAIINLDDIKHLDYLDENAGLPEIISFRYGPMSGGNDIIGTAKEAKFGLTREQLFIAYANAKAKGIRRFGLHTMPISNELNSAYFIEAAHGLFSLAKEIEEKVGIVFEFINMGGGIGIAYRPEDSDFDLKTYSQGICKEYEEAFGDRKIKLFLECGRFITGPFGYLVSTARHVKEAYKSYVGLDACMANLMRPGMYGAYHHITVLGKENEPAKFVYDVVGSLCENNDKFAVDRHLPQVRQGDILVIHDAGAHGHAMGFNYNGKLRSAEFLMSPGKSFKMIRRAETIDDLFATLVD